MSQRKIIWFAIVMSTFIYAVMVYSMSRGWPQPGPFAESVQQPRVLSLYAAAVAMFLAALMIPGRIAHHHQRYIVRLALFESCAVLGLLVALLTRDWRLFLAPWAMSLIGFMSTFPSDVE